MPMHTQRTAGSAAKALVAAGLGVVLLAGAGGTFALWSAKDTLATGTITDGQLSLSVANGQWSNGSTPIDIATYRMVPGDTVTFSASVTPTIVGDNLQATLVGSLPATPGAEHWTVSTTVPNGSTTLTDDQSGVAVPVRVAVTLPETSGNASQQATLALSELTFTLHQVDPTP